MKKNSIRKLTIAGVLVAVAVVGSLFSIPVLGAKCSPVQHMVNMLPNGRPAKPDVPQSIRDAVQNILRFPKGTHGHFCNYYMVRCFPHG